jgi:predicted ATPase
MRRGDVAVQGTASRKHPVRLRLGFLDEDLGYAIEFGLPPLGSSPSFPHDPEIKREVVFAAPTLRPSAMLVDRAGPYVRARGPDDEWQEVMTDLGAGDSMLAEVGDPRQTPELHVLRQRMRSWRFYDHFRTDAEAPARQRRIGTRTPVLAHDGADLAAALETIRQVGDKTALDETIADAFAGSRVEIDREGALIGVSLRQPGMLRPLAAAELSDGTLRYLLWCAALLTPRAPELMVLNEPETSLHPDLLPPLGRLIVHASRRSQILVVSHARGLLDVLEPHPECLAFPLEKELGETRVAGRDPLEGPGWAWPG